MRSWWPWQEPDSKSAPAIGRAPAPQPAAPVELTTFGELLVLRRQVDEVDAIVQTALSGRLSKDVLLDILLVLHPIKVRNSVPVIPGRDGA